MYVCMYVCIVRHVCACIDVYMFVCMTTAAHGAVDRVVSYSHFHNDCLFFYLKKENLLVPNAVEKHFNGAF